MVDINIHLIYVQNPNQGGSFWRKAKKGNGSD
jgi:hypothetical protein